MSRLCKMWLLLHLRQCRHRLPLPGRLAQQTRQTVQTQLTATSSSNSGRVSSLGDASRRRRMNRASAHLTSK